MAQAAGANLLVVERILRDKDGVWSQISEERDLGALVRQMLVSSAVSLAVFGAVLGSSNGLRQALASTVKLPVLFLATLAICLPTLYLFNLVFGARLRMAQAVALIMVSITVTSVLTLAFAPISLFFRITAQSYPFFKLLNIGILLLTAIVGLRFLTSGMRSLNDSMQSDDDDAVVVAPAPLVPAQLIPAPSENGVAPITVGDFVESGVESPAGAPAAQGAVATLARPQLQGTGPQQAIGPAGLPVYQHQVRLQPMSQSLPAERPASMTLLYIWILLFGFVGTQLAWTLRPFFGAPTEPFQIFRNIDGTFYADVLRTIGSLFN